MEMYNIFVNHQLCIVNVRRCDLDYAIKNIIKNMVFEIIEIKPIKNN